VEKKKLINLVIFLFFCDLLIAQNYSGYFLNHQFDSVYINQISGYDSLNSSLFYRSTTSLFSSKRYLKKIQILPFDFKFISGNAFLNSQNDEQFVPGAGTQLLINQGIRYSNKKFTLQFSPKLLLLQPNNSRQIYFPTNYSERIWRWYYDEINRIDRPFDMMVNRIQTFFGDSYITYNLSNISLGFSSSPQWIGSGYFNSLAMTNTAPGLPQFFIRSLHSIKLPLFNIEYILYGGLMSNSNIRFPLRDIDSLSNLNAANNFIWNRYTNGLSISLQPKRLKNLHFGLSRIFYMNSSRVKKIRNLFPVFLFGRDPLTTNTVFDQKDQMFIFMLRYIFFKNNFEIYSEFGRNDFFANTRDFILNPGHSAGYIFGIKKIFSSVKNRNIMFITEYSKLKNSLSSTLPNRDRDGWYRHSQISGGYTNFGQIIGAGIGTGSNSINTDLIIYDLKMKENSRISISYIINNNDFLNNAFRNSNDETPWSAIKCLLSKNLDLSPNISALFRVGFIYERNILWKLQSSNESFISNPLFSANRFTPSFSIYYQYRF